MNLVDYPSIDELVANIINSRYSLVFIIEVKDIYEALMITT